MAENRLEAKIGSNEIPEVTARGEARTVALVAKGAYDLEATIKDNLYPGHGYDTGNLHGSYHTLFIGTDSAVVGTDVAYAPEVEYGTRFWEGAAHIRPAVAKVEPVYVMAARRLFEP